MPPSKSDQLKETSVTGQLDSTEVVRVESLTVEGNPRRIAEVNQAIREGRCKISRPRSRGTLDCPLDK
jgi:hypothetical protein